MRYYVLWSSHHHSPYYISKKNTILVRNKQEAICIRIVLVYNIVNVKEKKNKNDIYISS